MRSSLTRLVAVEADAHCLNVRIVLQLLKQNAIRDGARGNVAVLLPPFRMKRYEREQVYRSLEQIEPVTFSDPMEAVLWLTPSDVALISALLCRASLVGMAGIPVRIEADEYGVVIFR